MSRSKRIRMIQITPLLDLIFVFVFVALFPPLYGVYEACWKGGDGQCLTAPNRMEIRLNDLGRYEVDELAERRADGIRLTKADECTGGFQIYFNGQLGEEIYPRSDPVIDKLMGFHDDAYWWGTVVGESEENVCVLRRLRMVPDPETGNFVEDPRVRNPDSYLFWEKVAG